MPQNDSIAPIEGDTPKWDSCIRKLHAIVTHSIKDKENKLDILSKKGLADKEEIVEQRINYTIQHFGISPKFKKGKRLKK